MHEFGTPGGHGSITRFGATSPTHAPKLACSKVLMYIFKALVELFLYFLVVNILRA